MNPLKQELNINNERYQIIVSVKEQYLDGILTVEEGNKIIIKTTKYYSNYYEPNSNWKKMLDFLEVSYQFTQEKILLKKI